MDATQIPRTFPTACGLVFSRAGEPKAMIMRFVPICILIFIAAASSPAQAPVPANTERTPPSVTYKVDPQYSEEARRAKVQTSVMLSIVVNRDGTAEDIKVLRGAGFGLDERAIEAVIKWRFKPGELRGATVKVRAQVEVNFRLLPGRNEPPLPPVIARLNFTLPDGVSRPQLTTGSIPKGLSIDHDQSVSFHLAVDEKGEPGNITVLSSTDEAWESMTMQELQHWRFSPAILNGTPVPVEGIFELSWKVPAAATPRQ